MSRAPQRPGPAPSQAGGADYPSGHVREGTSDAARRSGAPSPAGHVSEDIVTDPAGPAPAAGAGPLIKPALGDSPADPRMRGFQARADLAEALALLRARAGPLPAESLPLAAAFARVLARDVLAPIDVPGFVRAAVDGYALRGEDSFGAAVDAPLVLHVRGDSLPGRPYPAPLGPGEAVRIATGSPLPEGADAVLQAELAREVVRGGRRLVELLGSVPPLRHIGQVGEDMSRGQCVLAAGRRLRPQDVGALASLGLASVDVVRRPRVGLLVTGDELVAPGTVPGPHQIVDSNSLVLAGLAARDGAESLPPLRARDGAEALRAGLDALLAGPGDVLLVTGATSVGPEDLMPQILRERGTLDVHGLAVRPASPTGIGRAHDGRPVFLVPGNPVSCLCAYELVIGPLVRALAGLPDPWAFPHRSVELVLARKIASKVGRTDFVRVRRRGPDQVEPVATSGASNLSSAVLADGFVLVDADSEGAAPGERVRVHLFDPP
ncbi:molybdopterin molybdotransferase MoeA [Nannocystis pusilla]|uniref:Molybdopterin molybdenumtransferase n=1 Tax=Nannocystis pusilla TaxID=889268 RepID=A0ABS7TZN6_9BACT|nr:gephyrin-like molybdotransferase Glp [Nannocystis pusilla]MBZ5713738.1 molybdopterin molybdotransferase MoeA [Nannocystis pusilla]